MGNLTNLTDADFKTKVLASPRPVVVEYWADG
jgi:hypothetical protein